MSRDKSTEATMRMLRPQAPQSVKVEVEDVTAPPKTVTVEVSEPAQREPEMVLVRKTVSNSAARTMVYLPPAMKRKFKEIAYVEGRKENDLCLEAFRDWLAKKGHFNLG